MNTISTKPLFTILGIAALGINAQAATIASYIDGTATTGANLAAPVAGITVTDLTSSGITFGTVSSITRSGETILTPAGPTAGSAASSQWLNALNNQVANGSPVSTGDYFSFTLTADSGNLPGLTSLTFDMVTAAAASDGAIDGTYQLFAAADEGSFTAVGLPGTAANPNDDIFPGGQDSSIGTVITANIDLTSLAPANSYEFRIALGDNSGAGVKTTWLQGIQVETIPEPSSTALLGLGGLALILRRRR